MEREAIGRKNMQDTLPLNQKYMLTIKEATAYFGIEQRRMRWLAEMNEGHYALFNGNRYLICRPAFEEYLLDLIKSKRQFGEVQVEE